MANAYINLYTGTVTAGGVGGRLQPQLPASID